MNKFFDFILDLAKECPAEVSNLHGFIFISISVYFHKDLKLFINCFTSWKVFATPKKLLKFKNITLELTTLALTLFFFFSYFEGKHFKNSYLNNPN